MNSHPIADSQYIVKNHLKKILMDAEGDIPLPYADKANALVDSQYRFNYQFSRLDED